MINPKHLVEYVIAPTLKELGMHSEDAVRLVLCTGMQESGLRHLHQLGGGPALGIYQMEPATHDDIHRHYVGYDKDLQTKLQLMCAYPPSADQMIWNLMYATAMCRLHYYRVSEPLPHDVMGMAGYWKRYYNTPKGKGTVEEFAGNAHNILGLL